MLPYVTGFPGASDSKESACNTGDTGSVSGWEDPLEKAVAIHSSILAWEIHGQRILVGYNRWVRKESDTTERVSTPQVISLTFIKHMV